MPRVVIGSPMFNHEKNVRESIESILGQTYRDFALVLVDDCSTDATPVIAQEYAARDARVTYLANPTRLGLVDNTRRAFEATRERYPDAEYFAWASDHDVLTPRWLEELVAALDASPDVVLAYPLNQKIGADGEQLVRRAWAFDTFGVTDRWTRVRLSILRMSAGNMVWGLFRASALARAGVYRRVLVPDRLLMTELAVYGQFKQVPEVLWFRRWYGPIFSLNRQRRSFFPGRRPLYMYLPWWMTHALSLFWTFAVQAQGEPEISRPAGALLALRYFLLSLPFHVWQTLRGWRIDLLARLGSVRPHERRLRLMTREIVRRGVGDWTWSHLKPYVGQKARRKTLAGVRRRVSAAAFGIVRRPALRVLGWIRAIPFVRRRVVPSLLKQELDQIPAAPIAAELDRQLRTLRQTRGAVLIGPWISEVGYELLYWIPFLNWALKTHELSGRRLVVVSRGGAAPWYRHLTQEYLDVFDLFTVDEFRQQNEERWAGGGNQKQFKMGAMDREIIARAKTRCGLDHVDVMHPSLMYRLLRYYWFDKAGVGLLTRHTDYRRLAPLDARPAVDDLPNEYVAVRFYFRPSFPDTPENRRFAADTIRALSRQVPVVLLNTGLRLDDHEDVDVLDGKGVYHVDRLMTPERNLDVQTQIIGRARAFVGTYGGLAYVAPFYGVPSIGFYSNPSELVPSHLDIGWRLGRAIGVPATAMDVRAADLLSSVFAEDGRRGQVSAAAGL